MSQPYYAIGEIIEHPDGTKLKVKPAVVYHSESCIGCHFFNREASSMDACNPKTAPYLCAAHLRADRVPVKFVNIKKNPN
jgi:hypothetical protein